MQELGRYFTQSSASIFAALVTLVFLLTPIHNAKAEQDISRGKLLIANEALNDPHFDGAVVLIVGHSNLGTLGLIINRPLHDGSTYFGGPIKVAGQRALAASSVTIPGAIHIHQELYFLDNEQAFEYLLNDKHASSGSSGSISGIRSVRFYAGISSWIPGQLHAEINADAWYVRDSTEEMVFSDNNALWEQLISEIHSQWVDATRRIKSMREVLHPTYNDLHAKYLVDILETYGH